MKRFAAAFLILPALALATAACSNDAGPPYTEQTAKIDPALQPQPPAPAGASTTSDTPLRNSDTTAPTPTGDATGADMPDHPTPNKQTDSPLDPGLAEVADKVKLTDEQWKAILSDEEYNVLRRSGTEYAFTGRYLNNDASDKGAYHCVGCGNKLYDAKHKFHSGCGWPSFNSEIEPGAITTLTDRSFGMVRTEMRCARCDGHLGHIFADAPDQPTGLRHCVNGTALIFVPQGANAQDVIREHRKKYAER